MRLARRSFRLLSASKVSFSDLLKSSGVVGCTAILLHDSASLKVRSESARGKKGHCAPCQNCCGKVKLVHQALLGLKRLGAQLQRSRRELELSFDLLYVAQPRDIVRSAAGTGVSKLSAPQATKRTMQTPAPCSRQGTLCKRLPVPGVRCRSWPSGSNTQPQSWRTRAPSWSESPRGQATATAPPADSM